MTRWMIASTASCLLLPFAAYAEDSLSLRDVSILYQPQPASYQPQGSDFDLADQGKSFTIDCVIGVSGHLRDCQAESNTMIDQNFIRIALGSLTQMIVAPLTRDGEAVAGRTLSVTCQFHRQDQPEKVDTALQGDTATLAGG